MINEYFKKKIIKLEQEREEKIANLSPENQQQFRDFERQFTQNSGNQNQSVNTTTDNKPGF